MNWYILDFDLANKHLIQFMLHPLQRTGTHLVEESTRIVWGNKTKVTKWIKNSDCLFALDFQNARKMVQSCTIDAKTYTAMA